VNKMEEKKTLEGILSVVDYNAKNSCSGGPAWASLIGDKELCQHNLEYAEFFKEFVGKNIRLTIEVVENGQ